MNSTTTTTTTSKRSNRSKAKANEKDGFVMNPFQLRYKCEIPGTGDFLENLLRQHPIPVVKHINNPLKVRDKLAYILGLFVRKSQSDDFINSGKIHNKTFRLCTKYLHQVVRDYPIYIQYLIDRGIIDLIEPGTIREKCGTYRFKPEYIGKKTSKYVIIDPVFAVSIYHHLRTEALAKYPILFDWIKKVTVDWEHAMYIRDQIISKREDDHWERNQDILWEIHDWRMSKYKLARTNRLITSVSMVQSEYRAALRIDGKPLVGLDIKNSIPFLSIGLFDLAILKDQGLFDEILKFNPRLKDRGKKLIEFESNDTTTAWRAVVDDSTSAWGAVVGGVSVPSLTLTEIACEIDKYPDVLTYIQKVTDGSFYDYMAEYMDGASDGMWCDKPDMRKFAKKGLNKAINGQEFADPFELQIFSLAFPSVANAFRELQEGFYKTRYGKGDAKWQHGDQVSTYAYVTQRFEARIVLDKICGRISRERPEVPLITIHDSIYTLPEYVEYVHDIMVAEIQQIIGRPPMLDPTDYSKDVEVFELFRSKQNQLNSTDEVRATDHLNLSVRTNAA